MTKLDRDHSTDAMERPVSCDAVMAAAALILKGLASSSAAFPQEQRQRQQQQHLTSSAPSASRFAGDGQRGVRLPGKDTPAKRLLEQEISSLTARIHLVECRAASVAAQVLPGTPGENGVSSLALQVGVNGDAGTGAAAQDESRRGVDPVDFAPSPDHVELGHHEHGGFTMPLQHVRLQDERIYGLKKELASVKDLLLDQQRQTKDALASFEAGRVRQLERELKKHVQTNEAFQKVLREIGNIITAVAKGDLSKKVQVHATELDPEIATFKGTINTMMDQLQVFASEVSRVAREVGTEGILGGQAQITGVDGIWKELTKNGRLFPSNLLPLLRVCPTDERTARNDEERRLRPSIHVRGTRLLTGDPPPQ